MASPQQTPARRSRPLLIVLGILAVFIGIIALLSTIDVGRDSGTSTHGGVAVVELELDSARVEIRVSGDEVVVDRSVTTGFLGGSASETLSGDVLRVVFDCPGFGIRCGGEYVITVPAGTDLRGRVSNGPITLQDVDGEVDLRSSNGPITLTRVSSPVLSVATSNGSIEGTELTAPRLDVRTSNGRVQLGFSEPPDSVRARTSNGRIEVTLPSDSPAYAVTASTSNGSTSTNVRTDPGAASTLDLATSNGNISVTYGG
jgi:hypothetical protein